jgi:16S rRNA (cytosine1402-N4)-methyltransferase
MEGQHGAAGGAEGQEAAAAFAHTPVMLAEVLHFLQPRPGAVVVDATLGGGGHAARILEALRPGGRLVGIDRDPAALAAARARLLPLAAAGDVRLDIVRANYADLAEVLDDLGIDGVDGVLLDCGVNSAQFDQAARGFSYREDAPLDMRMDPDQPLSAYHLVNGLSEDELAGILRRYGEERWASRIAAFVVRRRRERGLITTTGELVELIAAAVPASARRHGPHPARRTFQALRIAVNGELDALAEALRVAAARLRPGGRLVVISFHSLEDRTVKHLFRELSRGCVCPPDWPVCRCGHVATCSALVPHPVEPSAQEVAQNPRARSAKLRAVLRLPRAGEGAAARPAGEAVGGPGAADGGGDGLPPGGAALLKPLAITHVWAPRSPRVRGGRRDVSI